MSFSTQIKLLIALIAAVGLWQIVYGLDVWASMYGVSRGLLERGELYRIAIGPLGHISFVHFWFNVLLLHYIAKHYQTGQTSLIVQFYCVLILSIIIGAVSYSLFGGEKFSVGISGGIFGLIGFSILRFDGEFKENLKNCLILTLMLGCVLPDYVDNITHITGLITGYLIGKILNRQRVVK
jgi:membrane associated rhomboid family serine protease